MHSSAATTALGKIIGTAAALAVTVFLLSGIRTASGAEPLPPDLAILDAQFLKLQAERVTAPFEADLTKLNSGYFSSLARKIADEKAAGHLDDTLWMPSKSCSRPSSLCRTPTMTRPLPASKPCV